MKKEIAELWIADLRNPENKQTIGRLQDDTGHCCLGRLAIILGECPTIKIESGCQNYYFDDLLGSLSSRIQEKAGMKTDNGEFEASHGDICLTELNDQGKTFAEIADVIEKNWERI